MPKNEQTLEDRLDALEKYLKEITDNCKQLGKRVSEVYDLSMYHSNKPDAVPRRVLTICDDREEVIRSYNGCRLCERSMFCDAYARWFIKTAPTEWRLACDEHKDCAYIPAEVRMPWATYVIYSASRDRYYTGISKAPHRRLRQHNGELSGGAKATRTGRPWKLVFAMRMCTQTDAMKEERDIKKMSHDEKTRRYGGKDV